MCDAVGICCIFVSRWALNQARPARHPRLLWNRLKTLLPGWLHVEL